MLFRSGSDADGDGLTFTVVAGPSHGTLSGAAPNLTYTPAADYNGPDSFTFKVNDGTVDSSPATVSITVTSYTGSGRGGGSGCSLCPGPASAKDISGWALPWAVVILAGLICRRRHAARSAPAA